MGPSYLLALPVGDLGAVIDPAHTVHADVGYSFKNIPLYVGFGLSPTRIGRYRARADFDANGTTVDAPISVNHSANYLTLIARFDLNDGESFATPYILGRAGMLFTSTGTIIRDPRGLDPDWPEELYAESTNHSSEFIAGLGLGCRIDAHRIFGKISPNSFFLLAEADFTYAPSADFGVTPYGSDETPDLSESPANAEWVREEYHDYQKHSLPYTMVSFRIGLYMHIYKFKKGKAKEG